MTDTVRTHRTWAALFAGVSVLIAGGTALFAWTAIERYEGRLEEERAGGLDRDLVVAAKELAPGHTLTADDLTFARRPVGADPTAVYEKPEDLIGRTVSERMLAGETVRRERMISGGARPRVDEIVEEGSRAVTVRASRAAAVGGLLVPGTFVDVVVTIRPDVQTLSAQWVTETILQGVRVLAVGDEVSVDPDDAESEDRARYAARETWVTLEVSPEEVEHVALGSARGQLHLSLRPKGDFSMMDAGKPLVTNALVGLPTPVVEVQAARLSQRRAAATRSPAPTPPGPTPPAHVTETIRGGVLTTEQFDAEGNRIPQDGRKR